MKQKCDEGSKNKNIYRTESTESIYQLNANFTSNNNKLEMLC